MRTLGIDYGDSRVGIAITDALGITAQGIETIQTQGSDKIVLRKLDEIFEKYNNEIDTIVVGLPINMDGTEGFRVDITKKFIDKLKCKYGSHIKIETVDERLTTVMVDKTMIQGNVRRKDRRQKKDEMAAVIILQNYLDKMSF